MVRTAVDDIAKIAPSASANCQFTPKSMVIGAISAMLSTTWSIPSPKTMRFME